MSKARIDYSNLDDRAVIGVEGASAIINLSVSTLNKARLTGDGPPFLKIGGSVRYVVGDLRAWLASKRRHSTSEYPTRKGAA